MQSRYLINFTIMAELKKYTSFEALKRDEKQVNSDWSNAHVFSEFETFLKSLQSEYIKKKKGKTKNGKQLNP